MSSKIAWRIGEGPVVSREFVESDHHKECLDNLRYQIGVGSGRVIGIAGPRGIGKTQILEEFCKESTQGGYFTYIFPSPKRYAARDFVISLYKEIVSRHIPKEMPFASQLLLSSSEARFKVLFTFSIALMIVTGLMAAVHYWLYPLGENFWRYLIPIGVAAYVVLPTVTFLQMRARLKIRSFLSERSLPTTSLPLIRDSLNRLRRIVYNEKISTYGGAEIKGVRLSRTHELSVRPFTDRELVEDFRSYVDELTKYYKGVVICIDELDKMTEPSSFKEFLTRRQRTCCTCLIRSVCSFCQYLRMPL